ncbi:hypothetical protein JCM11641_003072 [Rhodosporidiobolus odoratus]
MQLVTLSPFLLLAALVLAGPVPQDTSVASPASSSIPSFAGSFDPSTSANGLGGASGGNGQASNVDPSHAFPSGGDSNGTTCTPDTKSALNLAGQDPVNTGSSTPTSDLATGGTGGNTGSFGDFGDFGGSAGTGGEGGNGTFDLTSFLDNTGLSKDGVAPEQASEGTPTSVHLESVSTERARHRR